MQNVDWESLEADPSEIWSDAESIARDYGIPRRTLSSWATKPESGFRTRKQGRRVQFRLFDVLEYRDRYSRSAKRDLGTMLFVPENVDFEGIMDPSRVHLADRARYFLHLTYRQMQWQERDPFLPGSTVRLKAEYFRRLLTKRHYRRILDDLEAAGVIYVVRRMRKNKSYEYGFGPKITESRPGIVCYYPKDKRLRGLIRQSLDKRNAAGQQCLVCRRLSEDLRKVDILVTEAKESVRFERKDLTDFDPHDLAIDRISLGDFYCFPSKTGRVHHNITNLCRDSRRFLQFNRRRLVELDIANSQPLLVGLLCLQHDIKKYPLTHPGADMRRDGPHREPLRCPDPRDLAKLDVRRYVEAAERGQIYEHLQEALEKQGVILSRDEIKVRLFKRFFFIRFNIRDEPIVEVFRTEFPTIYDFVVSMRRNGKSQLAATMQRMEADIVIYGILARLQEMLPDEVFLTIHDSILTTPNNAKIAKKVMEQEFAKLGAEVMVKAKYYFGLN